MFPKCFSFKSRKFTRELVISRNPTIHTVSPSTEKLPPPSKFTLYSKIAHKLTPK